MKKNQIVAGLVAGVVGLVTVIVLFMLTGGKQASISEMLLTNVSENSATVVFTSDIDAKAEVVVINGEEEMSYYDERDMEEIGVGEYELTKQEERLVHHVKVSNLSPDENYEFKVKLGGKEVESELMNIETTEIAEKVNTPDPAYGQLFFEDETKVEEGVVVFQRMNEEGESQLASAVVSNGSYTVDTNGLKVLDMTADYANSDVDKEEFSYYAERGEEVLKAKLTTSASKDQPVDDVLLKLNVEKDEAVYGGKLMSDVRAQNENIDFTDVDNWPTSGNCFETAYNSNSIYIGSFCDDKGGCIDRNDNDYLLCNNGVDDGYEILELDNMGWCSGECESREPLDTITQEYLDGTGHDRAAVETFMNCFDESQENCVLDLQYLEVEYISENGGEVILQCKLPNERRMSSYPLRLSMGSYSIDSIEGLRVNDTSRGPLSWEYYNCPFFYEVLNSGYAQDIVEADDGAVSFDMGGWYFDPAWGEWRYDKVTIEGVETEYPEIGVYDYLTNIEGYFQKVNEHKPITQDIDTEWVEIEEDQLDSEMMQVDCVKGIPEGSYIYFSGVPRRQVELEKYERVCEGFASLFSEGLIDQIKYSAIPDNAGDFEISYTDGFYYDKYDYDSPNYNPEAFLTYILPFMNDEKTAVEAFTSFRYGVDTGSVSNISTQITIDVETEWVELSERDPVDENMMKATCKNIPENSYIIFNHAFKTQEQLDDLERWCEGLAGLFTEGVMQRVEIWSAIEASEFRLWYSDGFIYDDSDYTNPNYDINNYETYLSPFWSGEVTAVEAYTNFRYGVDRNIDYISNDQVLEGLAVVQKEAEGVMGVYIKCEESPEYEVPLFSSYYTDDINLTLGQQRLLLGMCEYTRNSQKSNPFITSTYPLLAHTQYVEGDRTGLSFSHISYVCEGKDSQIFYPSNFNPRTSTDYILEQFKNSIDQISNDCLVGITVPIFPGGNQIPKDSGTLFRSLFTKSNAQSLDVVDPGIYEISGTSTQSKTYEVTTAGPVKYFHDTNGNGIRDLDEEYLTDAESSEVSVNINKVAELESYRMNVGWNVMSFPMVMQDEETSQITKASELLNSLNEQGANVTHITVYREGDFIIYSEREDNNGEQVTFGEDYMIMPGEAYFVKNYESATVKFMGKKVEGSMEVLMNPGWNLVAVYNGEVQSYKGFDVMSQMSTQGVDAEVISKWDGGQYVNIVVNGGTKYGTDFDIYPTSGYWVKNASTEVGKFKPE